MVDEKNMSDDVKYIWAYLQYVLADTAFELRFIDSESIKEAREEIRSLGVYLPWEHAKPVMSRKEYDQLIKKADDTMLVLYDNALLDAEAEKRGASTAQIIDSTKRMQ